MHIFERMIRKFGYDDIYRFAGEGDEKKVLVGIRRKKERAKKKKAAGADGEDGEEVSLLFCVSSSKDFPFHISLHLIVLRAISIVVSVLACL